MMGKSLVWVLGMTVCGIGNDMGLFPMCLHDPDHYIPNICTHAQKRDLSGALCLAPLTHSLRWFELVLRNHEPFKSRLDRVRVVNAGAGGTTSSFMALCHNSRVPQDVDLVFVYVGERGINTSSA